MCGEAMIEGGAGSGEAAARQRLDALVGGWCWLALVLQSEHQDALETTDVDQVEAQCSGTGGLQALGRIPLGQAQQALTLTHLGPRKGRVQQALGKLPDVRTERQ